MCKKAYYEEIDYRFCREDLRGYLDVDQTAFYSEHFKTGILKLNSP